MPGQQSSPGGKKGRKVGRDKAKCEAYRRRHSLRDQKRGKQKTKKFSTSKEHRGCGALAKYMRHKAKDNKPNLYSDDPSERFLSRHVVCITPGVAWYQYKKGSGEPVPLARYSGMYEVQIKTTNDQKKPASRPKRSICLTSVTAKVLASSRRKRCVKPSELAIWHSLTRSYAA